MNDNTKVLIEFENKGAVALEMENTKYSTQIDLNSHKNSKNTVSIALSIRYTE